MRRAGLLRHLGAARDELVVILAQLRHMRLAKRSDKAAVENQHYVLLATKIAQLHGLAFEILQGKIRRGLADLNWGCHGGDYITDDRG